jgi:hypothetical protein
MFHALPFSPAESFPLRPVDVIHSLTTYMKTKMINPKSRLGYTNKDKFKWAEVCSQISMTWSNLTVAVLTDPVILIQASLCGWPLQPWQQPDQQLVSTELLHTQAHDLLCMCNAMHTFQFKRVWQHKKKEKISLTNPVSHAPSNLA